MAKPKKGKDKGRGCANEGCNKIVKPDKWHPDQKFCSTKCSDVDYNKRRRESRNRDGTIDSVEMTPEKEIELAKQKVIDKAERDEKKKYLKQAAQVSLIADAIEGAIKAHKFTPPRKLIILKKGGKPPEDAVLFLSDMHIGEEIVLAELGGLAEYNFDIFCKRLEILAQSLYSIVSIPLKSYQIPKLNIFMLGDNVTGEMIYLGQRNYIDLDLGEQLISGAEKISEFLINMLDIFPKIEVSGVVGNHGRVGKKGEFKSHVNFDWFLYRIVQANLQNYSSLITFDFPKSYFCLKEVRTWRFLLQHGEDIPSYLRTPYYGMDMAGKDMRDMLQSIGQDYEYWCLGHWHEFETKELVRGTRFVNGSFVGGDLFSIKKLRKKSRPSQKFLGVSENHGATFQYDIYLDEGDFVKYRLVPYDKYVAFMESLKDEPKDKKDKS